MADKMHNLCMYCDSDVSDLSVECAECFDLVLCPQCYFSGWEFGRHVKTHPYIISRPERRHLVRDEPVFPSNGVWKGSEEITLLENLPFFGHDWEGLARCMPNKTAKDIRSHFENIYIDGNLGKVCTTHICKPHEIEDLSDPVSMLENDPDTNISDTMKCFCEDIGYMPSKQFFSYKCHDDEVHSIIPKSVNFIELEGVTNDLDLPCAQIYLFRASECFKREKLIIEDNLIQRFFDVLDSKPGEINPEIKVRNEMRIFRNLLTRDEHETLIQGTMEEERLLNKVIELKKKLVEKSVQSGSFPKSTISLSIAEPPPLQKQGKGRGRQKKSPNSPSTIQSNGSAKRNSTTSSSSKSSVKDRKRIYPFSEEESREAIYSNSCSDLLSLPEKKLCAKLDIDHSSYLALKIVLLRDKNILKKGDPNQVPLAPKTKVVRAVYKFLTKRGLIHPV